VSLVIDLCGGAAQVRGVAPARAPVPATPPNHGQGDARKKIVPVLKSQGQPSATEWEGGAYLSLHEWLDAPQQGGAILLQPGDEVYGLERRTGGASLISVDFHRIGDGRGYTHAFVLRNRLGYRGRLRALGAVTADQVFALAQVGFDSFELRADQTAADALTALSTFTVPYHNGSVVADAGARAAAAFQARVRLLERALREISSNQTRPALASSLSAEDMVITDVIARLNLGIDVFTLDTGRLHAETLALIDEVRARYAIAIAVHRPSPKGVADYAAAYGWDGFYAGLEQRKQCCSVRKLEPLAQALAGRGAWITGQRREQSGARAGLPEAEADSQRSIAKFNPLAHWSWADVCAYAAQFAIPMSPLYAAGYVSIGCAPCTKPIRPGEDPRNGRWWWEHQDSKECGLHSNRLSR
jgi:phosphoadenosine phosphosulfate reductase